MPIYMDRHDISGAIKDIERPQRKQNINFFEVLF